MKQNKYFIACYTYNNVFVWISFFPLLQRWEMLFPSVFTIKIILPLESGWYRCWDLFCLSIYRIYLYLKKYKSLQNLEHLINKGTYFIENGSCLFGFIMYNGTAFALVLNSKISMTKKLSPMLWLHFISNLLIFS